MSGPHHTKGLAREGDRPDASSYSRTYWPILSIQRQEVKQDFWDIQVADTHNYVTEDGCVHHNSGKTTGLFFKLAYMASMQEPSKDGIKRTRAVIVRNTMPQLKDTTLTSWGYWFKDGEAGDWNATDKKFLLRFGNVECEVLFRPLDTPDDVARVLSLEVNFAIFDEFVQIHKEIIEAMSARLGRYKLPDGTKPTVWGMWGSSNPSTEDNWWFDFLHNQNVVERIDISADRDEVVAKNQLEGFTDRKNHYFVQPSGLSPDAENLENLPGERGYYINQMEGKSEAWIKQFIDAEWGFSASGKPVVGLFKPDIHIAKRRLSFNPLRPLIVGFDPGLAGSAAIFGQENHHGQLLVLGELIQSGIGVRRFIREIFKPYVHTNFPGAQIVFAPDPAANNRTPTDERTVCDIIRTDFHYPVITETNNRLPLRLEAYDYYCGRLTDEGPAFLVDQAMCPIFIRALKGGWRWELNAKKGDVVKTSDPEKNQYSHPGDAGGYLCRYFHKLAEREIKHRLPLTVRLGQSHGNGYHLR